MMQSSVNRLVGTSATTAPRATLPVALQPAQGLSGGVLAAIIGVCLIPVIAILAGIILPSVATARDAARRTACYYNMRQIASAKEQAAMAENLAEGAAFSEEALSPYLAKGFSGLVCPEGGRYTANPLDEDPACSEHGSLSDATQRRRR